MQKKIQVKLSWGDTAISYHLFLSEERDKDASVGEPICIIALHGYGESGKSFGDFSRLFRSPHKIIALDLPLHGESDWPPKTKFFAEQLEEIILAIMKQEKVNPFKWWLMGFSMGGRLGLSLAHHLLEQSNHSMPANINQRHQVETNSYRLSKSSPPPFQSTHELPVPEKIILFAPDGIIENPWYVFATQNRLGNLLFRTLLLNDTLFSAAAKLVLRWNLSNLSILKFIKTSLHQPAVRKAVCERWTCFSPFRISKKNLGKVVGLCSTFVAAGKYDRIIPPEIIALLRSERELFLHQLKKTTTENATPEFFPVVVPAGHQLLKMPGLEKLVKELSKHA